MAEERIVVRIDDAELIGVLNRIDVAKLSIPRLTRAQRILATQIPGAREALGLTFRARTLLAANPALAAAVAAIFIQKGYERFQKDQLKKNATLEDLIREGLDINHQQFLELSDEQRGFASFFDQFETRFEEEFSEDNLLEFIRTTVREFLLSLVPVVPDDDGVDYVDPWSEPSE